MGAARDITGLVLTGGRGARMGGLDKGLQLFHGEPLARHCLRRLSAQVGCVAINANRNLAQYQAWGVPVWSDGPDAGEFAGPLAGFLAGLQNCKTLYLCTVACDTPLFPVDLVDRMAACLFAQGADLVMATAPEEDGQFRPQPVFCLMRVSLRENLQAFLASGGRKVDAWTATLNSTALAFDRAGDNARAFFNANTLEQLRQLERA